MADDCVGRRVRARWHFRGPGQACECSRHPVYDLGTLFAWGQRFAVANHLRVETDLQEVAFDREQASLDVPRKPRRILVPDTLQAKRVVSGFRNRTLTEHPLECLTQRREVLLAESDLPLEDFRRHVRSDGHIGSPLTIVQRRLQVSYEPFTKQLTVMVCFIASELSVLACLVAEELGDECEHRCNPGSRNHDPPGVRWDRQGRRKGHREHGSDQHVTPH